MVWGCMFATGVGKICFLKRLINAAIYHDALDYFLIIYIEDKFGNKEFIFQHDLAPPQTVKSTKEWFMEKKIPVLDWPTNSPDTNPIENL